MFSPQTQKLTANLSCSHRPVDVLNHGKLAASHVELRWLNHIRFPVTRTRVERTSLSPPESAWT